jgi:hypothetical protein
VWLPLLRAEVTRTLGKSLSLVSAVATRWTSTWLSTVSVLQVCDALRSGSAESKERVFEAMTSRSVKYKNLKDVIEIVQSPTLFEHLGEHLEALLPTIEASIVCQGGSVTSADVMYCFGRLFQSVSSADEVAVLVKLEKQFVRLEKPLFILVLISHPIYAKIGREIVDNGEVDVMTITT